MKQLLPACIPLCVLVVCPAPGWPGAGVMDGLPVINLIKELLTRLCKAPATRMLTPEAMEASDEDPSNQLLGSSITYRIAVGPQQGRKVMTLQTLPDCGDDQFTTGVGNVAGFSLHAGVAARAHERNKLEHLCRYIARPAVSTKRLSMTRNGRVRYELNQE